MALIPTRYKCDPWDLRLPKLVDRLGIEPVDMATFVQQYPILSNTPRVKGEIQYTFIGKDEFHAYLDVKHFKPEEITVKTINNVIVVEGKQAERRDKFGYISRHFVRKYGLPEDYDGEKVESSLSPDGILTIKAPIRKKSIEAAKEKLIPIEHTGVPHSHIRRIEQ